MLLDTYAVLKRINKYKLKFNPIQDGQICLTYPTMMKLGPVIAYLKKTQKIYKSHDTALEFC